MKRQPKRLGLAIALAVVAAGVLYWVARRHSRSSGAGGGELEGVGAAQKVAAFEVSRATFTDAVEGLIGTVKGDTIQLSFHGIEEILIKVHVKVGQRVKKGDLLFEIDHTRSGARKDQAEVAYERAKQMQKAGAATAMDLKEARSAYDIARRDYEDTFIRAPKDGYVSQIDRKVGEMVGRDISGPIAVLVSSQDKLYLETGVIESQVARVKADQKVEVLIESLGPPALEGRVTGVSREVTTTGRTGTVMVGLPAAVQAKLRPGLSATCRILTFNGQALVIPRQSFDKEKGGVYVIADGKAVFRPVTLGYVAPDYYEAAQGLAEGERIVRDLIINPVEDGAAVTVEGEPERYAAEKAAGS